MLSSPINYTVTHLADDLEGISHDRINRYLRGERLTPRLLWDNVKVLLQPSPIDSIVDDPDGDGQSKLDDVADMLKGVVYSKQLSFRTVLMDSWYATPKLMGQIDQFGVYYCPLKTNRRVDDSGGSAPYVRGD
nr:transposase [Gloeocapsopsis dulcis AAB1 = 1H9]